MNIEDFYKEVGKSERTPVYSGLNKNPEVNDSKYRNDLLDETISTLREYLGLEAKDIVKSIEKKLRCEHTHRFERVGESDELSVYDESGEIIYQVHSNVVREATEVINDKTFAYADSIPGLNEIFGSDLNGVYFRQGVIVDTSKTKIELGLFMEKYSLFILNKSRGNLARSAKVVDTIKGNKYIFSSSPLSCHEGMFMLLHEVGHKVVSDWYEKFGTVRASPYSPARTRFQKDELKQSDAFTYQDGLYVLEDERLANMFAINTYRSVLEKDGWSDEEIRALELMFYTTYVKRMVNRFGLNE